MARVWRTILCASLALTAPTGAWGQTLPMAMDDEGAIYTYISFDELEYRPGSDERPIAFDATAWVGGDFNRVWLKVRGESSTRGGTGGEAEGQLLFGRVVPTKSHLVLLKK